MSKIRKNIKKYINNIKELKEIGSYKYYHGSNNPNLTISAIKISELPTH